MVTGFFRRGLGGRQSAEIPHTFPSIQSNPPADETPFFSIGIYMNGIQF
jgi:hypothetical protein